MRLGVLSDTHGDSLEELPRWVLNEISDVDLIVHAGDYVKKPLLDGLRRMGNFVGVYGNMDSADIRNELPASCVFEAKGHKIGVTHPAEGGAPVWLERDVKVKFENVKVVIFGHSHKAKSEFIEDILYFNPGSATGSFPATYESIGIITIDEKINGAIINHKV